MAFELRVEFWRTSSLGDGLDTVVLEHPVANAVNVEAAYEELGPVLDNREVIAMSVFGVSGAAYVQVADAADLTEDDTRARLVTAGTQHWVMLKAGQSIKVDEKV